MRINVIYDTVKGIWDEVSEGEMEEEKSFSK